MKLYCTTIHNQTGSDTVYALLEYAFMAEFGDHLPEIKKTPNGKPFFPARPDIHFSLSHSKTHVLCALSDAPVGVDIESPRQISKRAVRYFCSPEELALFDPLDLWVLKESYIKLIGETLPLVKELRFTRDGDMIATHDKSAAARLYSIDGCHVAVSTFDANFPGSIVLICGSLDLI